MAELTRDELEAAFSRLIREHLPDGSAMTINGAVHVLALADTIKVHISDMQLDIRRAPDGFWR